MSFININNTSIKVSNIKSFGISSTTKRYIDLQIFEKTERKGFLGVLGFAISIAAGGTGSSMTPTEEYKRLSYEKYYNRLGFNTTPYFYRENKNSEVQLLNTPERHITEEGPKIGRKTVTTRYLYITTYQNDNYQFYDDQINVDKEYKNIKNLTK